MRISAVAAILALSFLSSGPAEAGGNCRDYTVLGLPDIARWCGLTYYSPEAIGTHTDGYWQCVGLDRKIYPVPMPGVCRWLYSNVRPRIGIRYEQVIIQGVKYWACVCGRAQDPRIKSGPAKAPN